MQCTAEAGSAEDGRSAVLRAPPGGGMARPMFSTLSRSTNKFQVRKPPPPRNRRRAATAGARVPPVPHGTSHNASGHIIERTLNSTRLRGMDAMPATAKNTAPRTNEHEETLTHAERTHTCTHAPHTTRDDGHMCCLPAVPPTYSTPNVKWPWLGGEPTRMRAST